MIVNAGGLVQKRSGNCNCHLLRPFNPAVNDVIDGSAMANGQSVNPRRGTPPRLRDFDADVPVGQGGKHGHRDSESKTRNLSLSPVGSLHARRA